MTFHVHDHPTAPMARRVTALERALVAHGAVTTEQLDDIEETFSRKLGAHHGARYVARAWVDDEFRRALLDDAAAVVREHGYDLQGATNRDLPFLQLVAVENTPEVHNLVVCTLCSCYPVALLGPPPRWYKSFEYRARAVREPRAVLEEFGVHLAPDAEIRVWDSTSDNRYLVIPRRPEGAEEMNEDELARLVTRNSLIGTELVTPPDERP